MDEKLISLIRNEILNRTYDQSNINRQIMSEIKDEFNNVKNNLSHNIYNITNNRTNNESTSTSYDDINYIVRHTDTFFFNSYDSLEQIISFHSHYKNDIFEEIYNQILLLPNEKLLLRAKKLFEKFMYHHRAFMNNQKYNWKLYIKSFNCMISFLPYYLEYMELNSRVKYNILDRSIIDKIDKFNNCYPMEFVDNSMHMDRQSIILIQHIYDCPFVLNRELFCFLDIRCEKMYNIGSKYYHYGHKLFNTNDEKTSILDENRKRLINEHSKIYEIPWQFQHKMKRDKSDSFKVFNQGLSLGNRQNLLMMSKNRCMIFHNSMKENSNNNSDNQYIGYLFNNTIRISQKISDLLILDCILQEPTENLYTLYKEPNLIESFIENFIYFHESNPLLKYSLDERVMEYFQCLFEKTYIVNILNNIKNRNNLIYGYDVDQIQTKLKTYECILKSQYINQKNIKSFANENISLQGFLNISTLKTHFFDAYVLRKQSFNYENMDLNKLMYPSGLKRFVKIENNQSDTIDKLNIFFDSKEFFNKVLNYRNCFQNYDEMKKFLKEHFRVEEIQLFLCFPIIHSKNYVRVIIALYVYLFFHDSIPDDIELFSLRDLNINEEFKKSDIIINDRIFNTHSILEKYQKIFDEKIELNNLDDYDNNIKCFYAISFLLTNGIITESEIYISLKHIFAKNQNLVRKFDFILNKSEENIIENIKIRELFCNHYEFKEHEINVEDKNSGENKSIKNDNFNAEYFQDLFNEIEEDNDSEDNENEELEENLNILENEEIIQFKNEEKQISIIKNDLNTDIIEYDNDDW